MRVTILKEIPQDPALVRDWNQLVERMEHPEVFFTYQWALAVSRTFEGTLIPLLFLMYETDELRGVAALATHKNTRATASFLASTTADYCDIVSTPQNRHDVLVHLLQEVRKVGVRHLALSNLRSDSFTWKELSTASRAQRFRLACRTANEIGLVEFDSEEERAATISSVARKKTIKSSLKELSKQGPVQLTHLVNSAQAAGCLPQFVSAQVARFLATGRISGLVRPERRAFLNELSTLLSQESWLRITQLELNGQPIAWNYGFRFADNWFCYLGSFNRHYADYSPSACLLRLAVEEGCADRSIRELDLGLGDESYKGRFATSLRITYHVQLSRSLWRHALNTTWNFAKTKYDRSPTAAAVLRRGRDLTRSLQRRVRAEGLSATITHPMRSVLRLIGSKDEMLFFEAPVIDRLEAPKMRLEPVTWENLAEAAIANPNDPDTLQYLQRSAASLKEGKVGFVLSDLAKQAVHFLAVAKVNGFHLDEINHTITEEDSQAMLIFDCWTPAQYRGLGYYPLAIRWAAAELRKDEQRVWTFCSAADAVSIPEIMKAGFMYRYSLVRRQRLGQSAIVRRDRTYALPVDGSVISKSPDLAVGTEIGA
jgi:CelD/BcsL family acetyltransferase involved in cellulose biosynthesis